MFKKNKYFTDLLVIDFVGNIMSLLLCSYIFFFFSVFYFLLYYPSLYYFILTIVKDFKNISYMSFNSPGIFSGVQILNILKQKQNIIPDFILWF